MIPQNTFYLEVVNPLLASMEDLCPFTNNAAMPFGEQARAYGHESPRHFTITGMIWLYQCWGIGYTSASVEGPKAVW